jgi:hypothetical protein
MIHKGLIAIIITAMVSCFPMLLQAQPDPFGNDDQTKDEKADKGPPMSEKPFKERLVPGLASNALSLTFGGSQISVSVAPRLGYMLNRRWMAGVGAAYQYFKFESRRGSFEDQYYGGELFTNYRVYNNILVLGEYELMNVKDRQQFSADSRTWQPGLFLGLGYRQGGGRLIFDVKAKYNLNHVDGVSPYTMPLVIGFNVFLR